MPSRILGALSPFCTAPHFLRPPWAAQIGRNGRNQAGHKRWGRIIGVFAFLVCVQLHSSLRVQQLLHSGPIDISNGPQQGGAFAGKLETAAPHELVQKSNASARRNSAELLLQLREVGVGSSAAAPSSAAPYVAICIAVKGAPLLWAADSFPLRLWVGPRIALTCPPDSPATFTASPGPTSRFTAAAPLKPLLWLYCPASNRDVLALCIALKMF
jgi:hypothetical protein